MKRFRNILVVPEHLDADDPGLRRAIDLAETNAARLTVAGLLEAQDTPDYLIPLHQEAVDSIEDRLKVAAAAARDRGVSVKTTLLIGRPFVEIIRTVLVEKHDLVMKTARGRGQPQPRLFGSTAQHLLRKCPCPVWIVDPQQSPERRGVLAALDPDTSEPVQTALNTKIMELASSLAILETAPLHVVHAWTVPYEDMIHHSPYLRVKKVEASTYIREIEERHRKRLEATVEPFRRSNPGMSVHFVKGLPETVITDIAKEHSIGVVVMATVARTGVPGLLIGNTAENVLSRIDTSVLTIKPDAFTSPIAA